MDYYKELKSYQAIINIAKYGNINNTDYTTAQLQLAIKTILTYLKNDNNFPLYITKKYNELVYNDEEDNQ